MEPHGIPQRTAPGRRYVTLTTELHACIDACMATKTISIDLEAYERLRRARRTHGESFSKVIKRAVWPAPARTAAAMLAAMEVAPLMDPGTIRRLDEAQGADRPPEDRWRTE